MLYATRRAFLCCLLIAGCGTARFKDPAGRRLVLQDYDSIAILPIEVAHSINSPGLAEQLGAKIRERLTQSRGWTLVELEPTGNEQVSRIDLAVSVINARYPSRSKMIWLGSAHKMICQLQVCDHITGNLLGTARVSSTVRPLLGNAGLLNFGVVGILGRTAFDTRKHDTARLYKLMARRIGQALDDTKR